MKALTVATVDGDLMDHVLLVQVHLPVRIVSEILVRNDEDTVAWPVRHARVAVDGISTVVGFQRILIACVVWTLFAFFLKCNVICKCNKPVQETSPTDA